MATEFEIKLRAKSVEQLGEILRDAQVVKLAQEKLREIHMRTTYFDTADGALSERRWMLRVVHVIQIIKAILEYNHMII